MTNHPQAGHHPKTRQTLRPAAQLDDGDAFVPDFRHGFVVVKDDDAEAFGEEFIAAATSAEAVGEDARDELLDDELDGLALEMLDDSSLDELD